MSSDADTNPSTLGENPYGSQEEHRLRYLIRCRRKEERTDTELIHVLCEQEALDKEKVVHMGTSSTEKRMPVIFDYNNPTHDAAQICAFKTAVRSKKLKEISIPLEIQPYLNKRVENWKSQRENGIKFPIRDVMFPIGSADPNAPLNLIRTTGSAVPTQAPAGILKVENEAQNDTIQGSNAQ